MSVSLTTRFEIFKRDRFTCVYCGAHPPQIQIEIEHMVPLARGGTDRPDNLVTACFDCNHGKKDRPLESVEFPNWQDIADAMNFAKRSENERLRDLFLNRLDHGLETLADVVQAIWPEPD